MAERTRLDETIRETREKSIDSKLRHSQTLKDQCEMSKVSVKALVEKCVNLA